MRKMLKNKKKKGFTLIEMVAVVAIIGILAAILVPKITGYMNEAKKTAVIEQARKVVQAYEAAKMKGTDSLKGSNAGKVELTTSLSTALTASTGNTTMISLIADETLDKLGMTKEGETLKGTVTVGHCVAIIDGSDFIINDGVLDVNSVTPATN